MAEVREQASSKPVWATQREGWGVGDDGGKEGEKEKEKAVIGMPGF